MTKVYMMLLTVTWVDVLKFISIRPQCNLVFHHQLKLTPDLVVEA